MVNYAITHAVRARLALAEGDPEGAEQWARSAVRYALRTDFVVVQADARLGLASLLASSGLPGEAADESARACGTPMSDTAAHPGRSPLVVV